MLEHHVRSVMERTLEPLLTEAGFSREDGGWTSRIGDVVRTVELDCLWRSAVLRAGVGVLPALELLRSVPPGLDLSCGTVPASQLLQLWLTHGVRHSGTREETSGPGWQFDGLTPEILEASLVETFRGHILPFFDETSSVEGAVEELEREGKFGKCGALSRFVPRVNHFVAVALYLARGDRRPAVEILDRELAMGHVKEPWAAFRDWALHRPGVSHA